MRTALYLDLGAEMAHVTTILRFFWSMQQRSTTTSSSAAFAAVTPSSSSVISSSAGRRLRPPSSSGSFHRDRENVKGVIRDALHDTQIPFGVGGSRLSSDGQRHCSSSLHRQIIYLPKLQKTVLSLTKFRNGTRVKRTISDVCGMDGGGPHAENDDALVRVHRNERRSFAWQIILRFNIYIIASNNVDGNIVEGLDVLRILSIPPTISFLSALPPLVVVVGLPLLFITLKKGFSDATDGPM